MSSQQDLSVCWKVRSDLCSTWWVLLFLLEWAPGNYIRFQSFRVLDFTVFLHKLQIMLENMSISKPYFWLENEPFVSDHLLWLQYSCIFSCNTRMPSSDLDLICLKSNNIFVAINGFLSTNYKIIKLMFTFLVKSFIDIMKTSKNLVM